MGSMSSFINCRRLALTHVRVRAYPQRYDLPGVGLECCLSLDPGENKKSRDF